MTTTTSNTFSGSFLTVFLASIITSVLSSSASYTNYPGGVALQRLLYTHLGLKNHITTASSSDNTSLLSSLLFIQPYLLLQQHQHSIDSIKAPQSCSSTTTPATSTIQTLNITVKVHIAPEAAMTGISR